jgi:hypothetical protein
LKCASILSASTPSGTPNERWKKLGSTNLQIIRAVSLR